MARTTRTIKTGDWIRYQWGTSLHIGIVEYVRSEERYPYATTYVTSLGHNVNEDVIFEIRHLHSNATPI